MFTQGDRQNSDRKPDRLGPPDATPDHFRGQRLLVLCETMTSIEISSGWKDSVLVKTGGGRRGLDGRLEPWIVDGSLPHRRPLKSWRMFSFRADERA